MRRSLADLLTGLPNLAHLDLSGTIMTFLINPSLSSDRPFDLSGKTNLTLEVRRTTLTFR